MFFKIQVLKIWQCLQESICAGVTFEYSCRTGGLQLYQKEIPTQVLSSEYCEVFKNTYFEEYPRKAASVLLIIMSY